MKKLLVWPWLLALGCAFWCEPAVKGVIPAIISSTSSTASPSPSNAGLGASKSNTHSASGSSTLSASASTSKSSTPSASKSSTPSASKSSTPSASKSSTPSASKSSTPSASKSSTLSASASKSNTPSASTSSTPTASASDTASLSSTITVSPSATPSAATPSVTPSVVSLSATPSATPTATSPSSTSSVSLSATTSASSSLAGSGSPSRTSSGSPSRTSSGSPSRTSSTSPSVTPSASSSSTSSASPSAGPKPSVYWLQWHGKSTSCPALAAFISCGNAQPTDDASYVGAGAPCARATSLAVAMNNSNPSMNFSTFVPGNTCTNLRGQDNILGRLLNGIRNDQVCNQALADNVLPTGQFLTIEQVLSLRSDQGVAWIQSLKLLYPTQCAAGWVENAVSRMCSLASSSSPSPSPQPLPSSSPTTAGSSNINCVSGATNLSAVAACYSTRYLPKGSATAPINPNNSEASDLRQAVRALLDNDGNCRGITLGSAIRANMSVFLFTDSTYGAQYCLLMDTGDANGDGKFDSGFGFVAVANRRQDIHRYLVHSAPHPASEVNTEVQVMRLLAETGGHVGLVAGARRDATGDRSKCNTAFNSTDGVYDNTSAFYVLASEVYAWYMQ